MENIKNDNGDHGLSSISTNHDSIINPRLPLGYRFFDDNGDHGSTSSTNHNSNIIDSLPPGYRFKPFDEELIVHYLRKKVMEEELPENKIHSCNLYEYNPEALAELYKPQGEKEWYFFTPRERKYKNGDRPNRTAGNGYWKATGSDRDIESNGVLVGHKKSLVFYQGKPPNGGKTNWIMHEFRVDTPPRIRSDEFDMKLDDYVLCRIYKNESKSITPSAQEQDNNVIQPVPAVGVLPAIRGPIMEVPPAQESHMQFLNNIGAISYNSGNGDFVENIVNSYDNEFSYNFNDRLSEVSEFEGHAILEETPCPVPLLNDQYYPDMQGGNYMDYNNYYQNQMWMLQPLSSQLPITQYSLGFNEIGNQVGYRGAHDQEVENGNLLTQAAEDFNVDEFLDFNAQNYNFPADQP